MMWCAISRHYPDKAEYLPVIVDVIVIISVRVPVNLCF